MLLTLGEARNSALRNIAGACSNSPEFLSLLNEATRRLMRRGDWDGTVVRIQVCAYRGCIVFPRYVGKVRKVNVCGTPISMRNLWWDFLSFDPKGSNVQCSTTGCGVEQNMVYYGKTPTFDSVWGDGRLIRAYARCQADYGKQITIFGVDNNNQPLMHRDVNNVWQNGIIITLGSPFGSTSEFVRRIDRVLKDVTECPVDMFAYYAATDSLEPCAYYEPGETNPEYERYQLRIPQCCGVTGEVTDCGKNYSIQAVVKLRFVEAAVDTDLVLIENIDSLKDMMQSIKFKEAGDSKTAAEYEAAAIRELNLDLADQNNEDNMSVSHEVFRGAGIGAQRCW